MVNSHVNALNLTTALNIVPEAHPPQDVVEVDGREEALVLGVEHVEADLEHFDLVLLQTRDFFDLFKVDSREIFRFLSHGGRSLV